MHYKDSSYLLTYLVIFQIFTHITDCQFQNTGITSLNLLICDFATWFIHWSTIERTAT